jgi:hypothetical protein
MKTRCSIFLLFAAAISPVGGTGYAQDSPSLGELARQQRQEKEQSKLLLGKDSKAPKVITNEELPENTGSASTPAATHGERPSPPTSSDGAKQPAESWKSQILGQKTQIASLLAQIDHLNESIRFAPGNCVANCVAWNERQREKQQQVERMRAQLEDEQKRLIEMQESARKQGYGSSVYDP